MEPARDQETRNHTENEKRSLEVTGIGLVTPLDTQREDTFAAIAAGKRVEDQGVVTECALAGLVGICGAVPEGVAEILSDRRWDKSVRLGFLAALQAIKQANWKKDILSDPTTALFVGTSKGPVVASLAAYQQLLEGGTLDEIAASQVALGPGTLAMVLTKHLGMCGNRHTSVAACSSGMHALHWANRALRRGDCKRALVAAADASVHDLFEGSFSRLGVLAKPDADGHRRCRPFGEGQGFIIGEGAAAITLEREELGSRSRLNLTLEETWIGGDGTNLIAGDIDGEALHQGLRLMAGQLHAELPLAFIHAHATGTTHDAYEWSAIRSVFPNASLDGDTASAETPVFSHKGYLGHALGAAGLIGVVLSAMCHRAGRTLTGRPLPTRGKSLTLSQGFGGHIGMAALSSE